MANIIKQDTYINSDLENNHYKYWKIYLLDDNTVRTEWGRVGYTTGTKDFPHSSLVAAETFYTKKCNEKERPHKNKEPYVKSKIIEEVNGKVVVNNAPTGKQNIKSVINYSSPETERLINYLSQVNVHNILDVCGSKMEYDVNQGTFRTPLGIVTQEAIDEARLQLNKINDYVNRNDYLNSDFKKAAAQYLALIPQKVKTGKIDLTTIFYPSSLPIQEQTLENLEASLLLLNTKKVDDQNTPTGQPNFAAKVELLEDNYQTSRISRKYFDSLSNYHSCSNKRPIKYFKIEIDSMDQSYVNYGEKLRNVKELWHGSLSSNLISILAGGFKVAPPSTAKITGKLLGSGIYFSDCSTKSLGYSTGYWSGNTEKKFYMLLSDVALGNMYTASKCHGPFPPQGYDSVFGKAGYTMMDYRALLNNEYVVYKENQIRPLYLVEFE